MNCNPEKYKDLLGKEIFGKIKQAKPEDRATIIQAELNRQTGLQRTLLSLVPEQKRVELESLADDKRKKFNANVGKKASKSGPMLRIISPEKKKFEPADEEGVQFFEAGTDVPALIEAGINLQKELLKIEGVSEKIQNAFRVAGSSMIALQEEGAKSKDKNEREEIYKKIREHYKNLIRMYRSAVVAKYTDNSIFAESGKRIEKLKRNNKFLADTLEAIINTDFINPKTGQINLDHFNAIQAFWNDVYGQYGEKDQFTIEDKIAVQKKVLAHLKKFPIGTEGVFLRGGDQRAENVFSARPGEPRSILSVLPHAHEYLANPTLRSELLSGLNVTIQQERALDQFVDFRERVATGARKLATDSQVAKDTKAGKNLKEAFFTEGPHNYLRDRTTKQLNENTITALAAALFNFVGMKSSDLVFNTQEDVARMLGYEDPSKVSPKLMSAFKEGMLRKLAVQTIGTDAWKQHGLAAITDTDGAVADKAVTSLGLAAIQIAVDMGIIENDSSITAKEYNSLIKKGGGKSDRGDAEGNVPIIKLIKDKDEDGKLKDEVPAGLMPDVNAYSDYQKLGNDLFDIRNRERKPLDEPGKVKRKVQGSINEISPEMEAAMAAYESRPTIVNPGMKKIMEGLARHPDTLKKILGKQPVDEVHVLDEDGQRGLNIQIDRSVDDMVEIIRDDDGSPKYYPMKFVSNGRQMLDVNSGNYQNDKLHRAYLVLDSFKAKITAQDIAQGNDSKKIQQFKAAIGILMDVKVAGKGIDKLEENEAMWEAVDRKMDETDEIKDAIKLIQDKPDGDYTAEDVEILGKAMDKGEATMALPALEAWAKYKQGQDFDLYMPSEIDGLTNGYAISLLQIPAKSDGSMEIQLRRVGMFFKDAAKNGIKGFAAAIGKNETQGGVTLDTYQQLAEDMQNHFDMLLKDPTISTEEKVKIEALLGIIPLLREVEGPAKGEITKDGRNMNKPTVMEVNYGSGEASVKEAMGRQVVFKNKYGTPGFYGKLVKAGFKGENAQVKNLLENVQKIAGVNNVNIPANLMDMDAAELKKFSRNFVLSTQAQKALQDAGEKYLGGASWSAVEKTLGEQIKVRRSITSAITLMNHIYVEAFNQEVENFKQENGRLPTDKEEREIKISLRDKGLLPSFKHASSIEGDYSTYLEVTSETLVSLEEAEAMASVHAGAINLKEGNKASYTQQAQRRRPNTNVGVKGYVRAIQALDGHIMAQIYKKYGVYNIFDAIMASPDKIEEMTRYANQMFAEENLKYSLFDAVNESLTAFEEYYSNMDQKTQNRIWLDAFGFANNKGQKKLPDSAPKNLTQFRDGYEFTTKEKTLEHGVGFNENLTTVQRARKEIFNKLAVSNQFSKDKAHFDFKIEKYPEYANLTNEEVDAALANELLQSGPERPERSSGYEEFYRTTLEAETVGKAYEALAEHDNVQISQEHEDELKRVMEEVIIPGWHQVGQIHQVLNRNPDGTYNNGWIEGQTVELNIGGAVNSSPINMSLRETAVHEYLHALARDFINSDVKARRQVEELLEAARKVVKWEDFLPEEGPHTQYEKDIAKKRYDYIFNNPNGMRQLHEFVAIAASNEQFAKILAKTEYKESWTGKENPWQTRPLQAVWDIIMRALDWLTNSTPILKSGSVHENLNNLLKSWAYTNTSTRDSAIALVQRAEEGVGRQVEKANEGLEKLGLRLIR